MHFCEIKISAIEIKSLFEFIKMFIDSKKFIVKLQPKNVKNFSNNLCKKDFNIVE